MEEIQISITRIALTLHTHTECQHACRMHTVRQYVQLPQPEYRQQILHSRLHLLPRAALFLVLARRIISIADTTIKSVHMALQALAQQEVLQVASRAHRFSTLNTSAVAKLRHTHPHRRVTKSQLLASALAQ